MRKHQVDEKTRFAVIEAYRDSMRRRYSLENIGRFADLADISDEIVHEIRDFFLVNLYPPPDKRKELDEAFDHLGVVLRSPRKMFPLVGMAGRSIFKLGALIPAAIAAGGRTLETYLEIRKLEKKMIQAGVKLNLEPEAFSDIKTFHKIILSIPEKEIIRFRRDIIKLFDHLSNTKLLSKSVEILADSRSVMESHNGLYSEKEMLGVSLGHSMLESGLDLFQKLTPDQVPLIHKSIEKIEIDWYDNIKNEYS